MKEDEEREEEDRDGEITLILFILILCNDDIFDGEKGQMLSAKK